MLDTKLWPVDPGFETAVLPLHRYGPRVVVPWRYDVDRGTFRARLLWHCVYVDVLVQCRELPSRGNIELCVGDTWTYVPEPGYIYIGDVVPSDLVAVLRYRLTSVSSLAARRRRRGSRSRVEARDAALARYVAGYAALVVDTELCDVEAPPWAATWWLRVGHAFGAVAESPTRRDIRAFGVAAADVELAAAAAAVYELRRLRVGGVEAYYAMTRYVLDAASG